MKIIIIFLVLLLQGSILFSQDSSGLNGEVKLRAVLTASHWNMCIYSDGRVHIEPALLANPFMAKAIAPTGSVNVKSILESLEVLLQSADEPSYESWGGVRAGIISSDNPYTAFKNIYGVDLWNSIVDEITPKMTIPIGSKFNIETDWPRMRITKKDIPHSTSEISSKAPPLLLSDEPANQRQEEQKTNQIVTLSDQGKNSETPAHVFFVISGLILLITTGVILMIKKKKK